jgi:hypothetical protein
MPLVRVVRTDLLISTRSFWQCCDRSDGSGCLRPLGGACSSGYERSRAERRSEILALRSSDALEADTLVHQVKPRKPC